MAGADETLLRAHRLQLPFRQRRRTFEEFFFAANSRGDYLLAPAYDLLKCRGRGFRTARRLIPEAEYSDIYTRTGHPCRADFETFGQQIGVLPKKMTEILKQFTQEQPEVYALTDRSSSTRKSSGYTNVVPGTVESVDEGGITSSILYNENQ